MPEDTEDPSRQLLDLTSSWAQAWSAQQVEDYLEFYARGFRPPGGMGRKEWEAQRRPRILKPARIEIELSALEIESVGPQRARVSFDQEYRSDSCQDVVRKTQELVREDGGWKILAEQVRDPDRAPSELDGS